MMQDVAAEVLRDERAQLAEQTIAYNLRCLGDCEASTTHDLWLGARPPVAEWHCSCGWNTSVEAVTTDAAVEKVENLHPEADFTPFHTRRFAYHRASRRRRVR